jgi:hypothetical protein
MLSFSQPITLGDGASGSACKLASSHLCLHWCLLTLLCRIWNGLWWVIIAAVYFPESQTRAKGQAVKEILKKIDYIGGILSITGLTIV